MVENMICKDGPTLFIPKIMFLTKGKGTHTDYLTIFELALRDAEIAILNLLYVSSIKPAQCKIMSRQEGKKIPNAWANCFCGYGSFWNH